MQAQHEKPSNFPALGGNAGMYVLGMFSVRFRISDFSVCAENKRAKVVVFGLGSQVLHLHTTVRFPARALRGGTCGGIHCHNLWAEYRARYCSGFCSMILFIVSNLV